MAEPGLHASGTPISEVDRREFLQSHMREPTPFDGILSSTSLPQRMPRNAYLRCLGTAMQRWRSMDKVRPKASEASRDNRRKCTCRLPAKTEEGHWWKVKTQRPRNGRHLHPGTASMTQADIERVIETSHTRIGVSSRGERMGIGMERLPGRYDEKVSIRMSVAQKMMRMVEKKIEDRGHATDDKMTELLDHSRSAALAEDQVVAAVVQASFRGDSAIGIPGAQEAESANAVRAERARDQVDLRLSEAAVASRGCRWSSHANSPRNLRDAFETWATAPGGGGARRPAAPLPTSRLSWCCAMGWGHDTSEGDRAIQDRARDQDALDELLSELEWLINRRTDFAVIQAPRWRNELYGLADDHSSGGVRWREHRRDEQRIRCLRPHHHFKDEGPPRGQDRKLEGQ